MFSDNKKGRSADPSEKQNRISEGTKIKGDIISSGGFRIDGEVDGTLETPNRVVIGKSGVLKGSLTCDDADIEGFVSGKIVVKNLLSLKTAAQVEGEVITGKLAVEPGANFNASCDMKGNTRAKDTKSDGKKA